MRVKPEMSRLLLLLALALPLAAQAEPQFARLYKGKYGYAPSCNACHKDGGGTPLNAYGQAFKDAKLTAAAFDAIAALDSDGDGSANGEEARAQANPGSAKSTPQNRGDWLATANLIPREVQKLYPGITAYKPLDATLTAAEIQRARALGVDLSARDENTIYVPVRDGKAAGTALIVPAAHQGKPFYLLVATDPKLVITQVQPLSTGRLPAAAKSGVYAGLRGRDAGAIAPAADPASLDGAITEAVRRAGALLTVRLKKG